MARQVEFAQPVILDAFIERLIQWGAIAPPAEGQYEVKWQDLLSPTEMDQAKIVGEKMQALKSYADSIDKDPMALVVVDPSEIREALGWSPRTTEELKELFDELGEIGSEINPEPGTVPTPLARLRAILDG